jgi:hypothetical protein
LVWLSRLHSDRLIGLRPQVPTPRTIKNSSV